jgi:hypothetical protein
VVWGVHFITPGQEYDPAEIETMPLDGLTHRYVMAESPHTFRVDLPNGAYEVALVAPAVAGAHTRVAIAGTMLDLGGGQPGMAKTLVEVQDGTLSIEVGGEGQWALAGMTIRPRSPLIAHLAPAGARAEEDLKVTATATAPDGIRAMRLRYRSNGNWQEVSMAGDGTAFEGVIPAGALSGDTLEYALVAEDNQGSAAQREGITIPVVRGFKTPRIVRSSGPATWSPDQILTFEVELENDAYANEILLHYREADQNRSFRQASIPAGKSGKYTFELDPRHLDGNYELIYYFEVRDRLGSGSFYPDPFSEARYWIVKPGND